MRKNGATHSAGEAAKDSYYCSQESPWPAPMCRTPGACLVGEADPEGGWSRRPWEL